MGRSGVLVCCGVFGGAEVVAAAGVCCLGLAVGVEWSESFGGPVGAVAGEGDGAAVVGGVAVDGDVEPGGVEVFDAVFAPFGDDDGVVHPVFEAEAVDVVGAGESVGVDVDEAWSVGFGRVDSGDDEGW